MNLRRILWVLLLGLAPLSARAQEAPSLYQTDFPPEVFAERRARIFDHIGAQALALIQGAPGVEGFIPFRQSNTLYYLCGVESPHAYLLLNGRTRRTTLYLPHRDPGRERGEGKMLSAEDAELVQRLTGVDEVAPIELLPRHWIWNLLMRAPEPAIYTPFSPAELGSDSRDEILSGRAGVVSDPWDGRPSRTGHFLHLLRTRYPEFELRNLTPLLDRMRSVKDPHEVALVRRASELAGLGLMEAIRSTEPGLSEYHLDAAARFVFQTNGARHEGYSSITASGANAWMGHYWRNNSPLADGDLVLMDYAPDYRYYTSDVARMWPVNGRFTPEQRALYGFVVAYRDALLDHIRPGVTPDQIMDETAEVMARYIEAHDFFKPEYERAVRAALTFRGHLSHPVGMAVHDVGTYRDGPLQPGHVFSIDPMIWVPEETLYVRVEDVVAVTETGVENFTAFVPATPDEIERLMREDGVVQFRPPAPMQRR